MTGAWQRLLPWVNRAREGKGCGATVRLLGAPLRSPVTVEEERTVALLSSAGPLPLDGLIDRLARDMYLEELRRGGWTTEVGVLGTAPFRPEAARAVDGAAGALWTIERARGRT